METRSKKEFLIGIIYIATMIVLYYVFLKYLFFYLLPFIIAFIIAFSVRKPAIFLSQKTKIKQNIISPILASAFYILTLTIFLLILYLVLTSFPKFITSITDFTAKFTDIFWDSKNNLNNALNKIFPEFSNEIKTFLNNAFSSIILKFTDALSSLLSSFAKKIPNFFFNFLVTLVATCFLAKDFNSLTVFIKSICPEKLYKNSIKIKNILLTSILGMIKGYFLLMIITFIELSTAFLILKINHPFLLGFIISLIDIFPILGTGAILIPWVIISFLIGDLSLGISLSIVYILITIIRNFLEPKLLSRNIGINPLFTLVAMFFGIKFFGISGLFILPITLIVIIKYYKTELENEKQLF